MDDDNGKYLHVPLSNVDINSAIKQFESRGANIIEDANIKSNTPIENIFKERGHAIIFHKYPHQQVGHWYVILRDREGNVFIIDSFGKHPDYYNKQLLQCLHNNGIKNIIYNDIPMQDDTSICGRYSILFSTLNKLGFPIDKMYDYMKAGKKKAGSYDQFVLDVTT